MNKDVYRNKLNVNFHKKQFLPTSVKGLQLHNGKKNLTKGALHESINVKLKSFPGSDAFEFAGTLEHWGIIRRCVGELSGAEMVKRSRYLSTWLLGVQ